MPETLIHETDYWTVVYHRPGPEGPEIELRIGFAPRGDPTRIERRFYFEPDEAHTLAGALARAVVANAREHGTDALAGLLRAATNLIVASTNAAIPDDALTETKDP